MLRKFLPPLFFLTIIYSVVGLLPFAISTGGPCNSGVAVIGIGFFLIASALLTFISMRISLKFQQAKTSKKRARVFSILSLFIWGFWTVVSSLDDLTTGLIYFTPFLITILLATIISFMAETTQQEQS
jgi:hypothetical protein